MLLLFGHGSYIPGTAVRSFLQLRFLFVVDDNAKIDHLCLASCSGQLLNQAHIMSWLTSKTK